MSSAAATATLTFTDGDAPDGDGESGPRQRQDRRHRHGVPHGEQRAERQRRDGHSIDAVTVTVEDDDVGVTVSESALTVGEGDATGATYTVVLDVAPSSDVVIDITATGDLTVSSDGNNFAATATLTFTASGSGIWSTPQTVTVRAGHDNDKTDDTATVSHTVNNAQSDNDYDGHSIDAVTVTVEDDDVGVTVSESALTVGEGDATGATYTVVLDVAPSSDVVIDITATGDLTVSSDGNNFAATATLTFTASGSGIWSTPQTVTVRAGHDDDKTDDTATVSHTVNNAGSDDAYDDAPIDDVTVTVEDDDVGVTVSESALTVGEGDATGDTYTVVLDVAPSSDVVIDITATGDLTVSSDGNNFAATATLTFTASGSGIWSTPQTVTVRAGHDADKTDDTATVTHTVNNAQSDNDYDGHSIDAVTVTVEDDDVGVTVSESALTVGEGDATGATYTVVLDVAPSSDVVIDITATGDLTVSSDGNNFAATATLTFTASGSGIWSTPQTVTVRAGHDDDKTDDTATVSHTVNNAQSDNDYDGHSIDAVTVTVEDDDVGVTVSESALTVGEGDATGATYTVVLDVAPSSDVVIDITATGDLTVSSDGNNFAATATLTFTASGSGIWSTPQTVTVRAGHDDDKTDDTATVSHTVNNAGSDDAYDDAPIDDVTVTVEDDDVGVTVSESALTVGEGDATGATYTVVLDVAPSSDVVIDITATGDLTVSSDGNNFAATATLTFTASGSGIWSTPQTVTVRAGHDDDKTDDDATVSHTVNNAQSDNDYDGHSIDAVTVTVEDDDVGVTVSESALTVGEGDATGDTYTVVLDVAPSSDVVIDITATGDLTVSSDGNNFAATATLTFTASGSGIWSTPQTVTVRAGHDDDKTDDDATVSHTVNNAQSDNDYDGHSIDAVTVTVEDDDVGVTVSESALTVGEGDATGATYTVVLDVAPSSDVVIDITAGGDLTVSSDGNNFAATATLTFTASGSGIWSTPQTVTVRAGHDDDKTDDTATVSHTVNNAQSDNDYDGHSIDAVTVTVEDDDDPSSATDDPGTAVTNVQVTKGSGSTATRVIDVTSSGYLQARVRLGWSAPVAEADDVVGYRVERRTHYCYADPAGVDQLTLWTKVHEWDFEQAAELHVGEEFSVDGSQLSFVDLGSLSTYVRDDGSVYTTPPSGVSLSSAEAGNGAFVTIRREYRIVTIRPDADPVYSTSVLVGYDHTATGNNRITATPQPTERSEPNCDGTAPAITLGAIVVSAIGSTTATVTVPINNADNTYVYFRYFSYATNSIGWQSRQVQVSTTTAQITLTGLEPGFRYYIQASLDSGFDRGRNRVTTFDTLPAG